MTTICGKTWGTKVGGGKISCPTLKRFALTPIFQSTRDSNYYIPERKLHSPQAQTCGAVRNHIRPLGPWEQRIRAVRISEFHLPAKQLVDQTTFSYPEKSAEGRFPFIENFQDALKSLGVSQSKDQAGSALGVFWSPNTIDPKNMTRSYSRNAYYDGFTGRRNLHVMTSRHVTKLLTKSDKKGVKITGIQVSKPFLCDIRRGLPF